MRQKTRKITHVWKGTEHMGKINKRVFKSLEEITDFVDEVCHKNIKCDVNCGAISVDGASLLGMLNMLGKECRIVMY